MTYDYVFTVNHEPDGSGVITFPKFPEIVCALSGQELQRGKFRLVAFDAVRNALQARIDYQDEIPASDKVGRDEHLVVSLSPLDILKISLYLKFRAADCSKAEFAKRAAITPTGFARALDLSHASRFDVLTDIFEKLGFNVLSTIELKRVAND